MDPKLMTVTQAAREMGVPQPVLNLQVQAGRIPFTKLGNYTIVNIDDCVRALRQHGRGKYRKQALATPIAEEEVTV